MRWNQVRTTYNGPLEQARLATNLFYWTNHLLHFNLLKEIAEQEFYPQAEYEKLPAGVQAVMVKVVVFV